MINSSSPLINPEIKTKKPSDLSQMKKIKDLFIMMITELNENLQLKAKLFSIQGFFPDILFLKLDFFSKKNISTKDILHYLEQHNYKFNDEMVRRFIKQYDKHGNYNLIYDDFLKMISPLDYNVNKIVDNDYKNIDVIFCEILLNELKLVGIIGEMALQIKKNDEFNSYDIFMELSKNENVIDKSVIKNFLLDGHFTEMEINQLIYYIDSNNDGIISYEDFHDLLMPIQSDFEVNENNNKYLFNNIDNNQNNFNYIINNDINKDLFPNKYYNYLLDNKYIYSMKDNPNLNYNDKPINNNINNLNINTENISNKKYDDNLAMKEIQENIANQDNNNTPDIQNILNTEKQLLYNKYLDNAIIDEQNINNDDYVSKTTQNFYPKILKEEKEDIPDIKENTFSKKYYLNNNPNTNNYNFGFNSNIPNDFLNKESEIQNNINENDIIYNNNNNYYSPNKENEIIENMNYQKENNYNDNQNENNNNNLNNVALQKFPISFGINLESNNDNEQQFINNLNNDFISNDINRNNNENNYKDEMHFIINKYLHNNNINDNEQDIDNNYNNIKYKTINDRQNMDINMDMDLLYNNESNINSMSPKTYSYPTKEKENINIINNVDIKNNIKHHSKKTKYKNCPNIIEAINNFLEYINLIILNENRIEHIKKNLALREDLSLKEIFSLFDKDQNNYISINNFQIICKKIFNLFPTLDQVKLVFKRYKHNKSKKPKEKEKDKDKEKYILNLDEFIKMMSPKKAEYINIINKKNEIDKTNTKLSVKSKKILIELIKCLIQKESDYYKVRNKFDENCLELLWKEITKYSKNNDKINKKQMNKFLEKYGYILQEKQIDNIFFIFDKEQKGKIKKNDFREEMCSD